MSFRRGACVEKCPFIGSLLSKIRIFFDANAPLMPLVHLYLYSGKCYSDDEN